MLTTDELCSAVGIPRRTVVYWTKRGLLPAPEPVQIPTGGRRYLWPAWLANELRRARSMRMSGKDVESAFARIQRRISAKEKKR